MELKISFLYILGITTIALIYKIVYQKIYGVEGIGNPFKKIGKKDFYWIQVSVNWSKYSIGAGD